MLGKRFGKVVDYFSHFNKYCRYVGNNNTIV
jgi:hypothetical protein